MSLESGLVCHWAKFPIVTPSSSLPSSLLASSSEVRAAKKRQYPSPRSRHTTIWCPSLEVEEEGEGEEGGEGGGGGGEGGGGASLGGKLLVFGGSDDEGCVLSGCF